MNIAGFAAALAKTPERSPVQAEKDDAIALARRVIQNDSGLTRAEAMVVSRQLLRALALAA